MNIYSIDGLIPSIDESAYIHPTAVIIGDVIIGPNCYIGPNSTLRGDFGRLVLEEGTNFQDNCVMHGFPNTITMIERNGHIGHGAVIHGCHIGENCLVGMNAVVMDGAKIGKNSIIAACSFVKTGFECEANSMVMGIPAIATRTLSAEELEWKSQGTAEYHQLAQRSLATMQKVEPFSSPPSGSTKVNSSTHAPLTTKNKS